MQTRGFCNWTANIHTRLGAGFSAACRHSRLLGSLLAPRRRSGAGSSSRQKFPSKVALCKNNKLVEMGKLSESETGGRGWGELPRNKS